MFVSDLEKGENSLEVLLWGGSALLLVILMKCFIQKRWIVMFMPRALEIYCPWTYSSKSFYKLQEKILKIGQIIVFFFFNMKFLDMIFNFK